MTMRRKNVVFVGAGHAALIALIALKGRLDANVTLVSETPFAHYSGMLPGFIEGIYQEDEMRVFLPDFAQRAGVRFVEARLTGADEAAIQLAGTHLAYDVLVLNTGAHAARDGPLGAPSVIPAKPFATLLARLSPALDTAASFAVIGAGAAGLELAFALKTRRADAEVTLVERATEVAPAFPASFRRRVARHLDRAGIGVRLGAAVREVADGMVQLADGPAIAADCTLAFSGVAPPSIVSHLPFQRTPEGFIAVDDRFRSLSHTNVLAVGDVATNGLDPRPKAGVFAVRSGPPLARAVEALVAGRTPAPVKLQRRALVLLSVGGRRAIGVRNGLVAQGRLAWWLKDRFDQNFMARLKG